MHDYQVRDAKALRARLKASKRVVPHSVRSVAAAAGTSRTTVSNLLTGKQLRVSEELAKSLAFILDVPVADLFMPAVSTSADIDIAGRDEA
jgi:transcriptional regulator with XRE-family HTH domain